MSWFFLPDADEAGALATEADADAGADADPLAEAEER